MWIVAKHEDNYGNEGWRLVIDFRQLNGITVRSCYPLPFTSDIIEKLVASNYISIMELKINFFQIKMDSESAPLTVTKGQRESFQYKKMAMGLKESSITFMRAIQLAIVGLSRDEMEIYLDDIIVFSKTL
jgi:hypothetical protein